MTTLKKIGLNISIKRKALKLTQKEFASKCGIGSSYVGQIERGLRNINFLRLEKIASALGCEIQDLLK